MSDQYNGQVETIASNLPVATNIVSSTNTTPIQVTANAHGLNEFDFVIILNHLVNTAANGIWKAHVVNANVFELVDSVGIGAGGATGNVLSLALGPTYAVPADGDAFNAAAFNAAYEALGDRTAFLWYTAGWASVIYPGGSLDVSGSARFSGDVHFDNFSRIAWQTPHRPTDAATIVVDPTQGYDEVILAAAAATPRVVQIKSTSTTHPLVAGQRITITMPTDLGASDGLQFRVEREDATVIADLWFSTASLAQSGGDVEQGAWVTLYWTGSVWRGLRWGGLHVPGAGW